MSKMTIDRFEVVDLGVTSPDYFQGFGVSFTDYTDCVYGIGSTQREAFEDCIEQAACSGRLDVDDSVVALILAESGEPGDDCIECECECECDDCECYSEQYFHVGLRWTVREDRRMPIIREMFPDVDRYEDYRGGGEIATVADGAMYLGDIHRADYNHDGALYAEIPYTGYGDYCGSTVEKSNCKAFLEEFGDTDFVHRTYGGHGSEGVMIGITGLLECDDDTFERVCDVVNGLADYPCIDEQLLSEVESEGCNEAWDSWVCSDVERAIERAFPDAEFDFDGDKLRSFFEERADSANEYWYCEGSGVDMYINIDRVLDGIEFDDVADFAVSYDVVYCNPDERRENYYGEAEASARAEELRADGCMGAYYCRS